MILRAGPDGGVLAIAQPDHAALAGRLAEAWDDELVPGLVAATHHHDDVWAHRDAAPPLDPATGRPVDLWDNDDATRLALWSRVGEVAAPLGPEAELWVLRHAIRLHEDYDAPALKAMVAAISVRADELVAALVDTQPGFDEPGLARGTSLLRLFDTLSLRLCFGVTEPVAAGVLRLAPAGGDRVTVAPWPFAGDEVATSVLARELPGTLASQAELDAAWAASAPRPLPITLVPA